MRISINEQYRIYCGFNQCITNLRNLDENKNILDYDELFPFLNYVEKSDLISFVYEEEISRLVYLYYLSKFLIQLYEHERLEILSPYQSLLSFLKIKFDRCELELTFTPENKLSAGRINYLNEITKIKYTNTLVLLTGFYYFDKQFAEILTIFNDKNINKHFEKLNVSIVADKLKKKKVIKHMYRGEGITRNVLTPENLKSHRQLAPRFLDLARQFPIVEKYMEELSSICSTIILNMENLEIPKYVFSESQYKFIMKNHKKDFMDENKDTQSTTIFELLFLYYQVKYNIDMQASVVNTLIFQELQRYRSGVMNDVQNLQPININLDNEGFKNRF